MNDTKLSEFEITNILATKIFPHRRWLCVPNVTQDFVWWEADLLAVSPSDWLYEIEIKSSPGDLRHDLIKRKHQLITHSKYIRHFYYACSVEVYETAFRLGFRLPDYAGLIFVNSKDDVTIHKKAPLSKAANKLTIDDRFRLARLASIKMWNLRRPPA